LIAIASLGLATVFTTPARADTAHATPPEATHPVPQAESGGGIVELVDEALSTIQLRQDQKDTVKKLGDEVAVAAKPVEEAKGKLLEELANEIGKGKVDAASFDDEIAAVDKAVDAAAPIERAAFEKLHATLDPQQRTEFADNMMRGLRKQLTHRKAAKDELRLTQDQKDKIHAIMHGGEGMARIDKAIGGLVRVLAAFEGDEFKLDEIIPPGHAGERVDKMARGLVEASAKVSDILTPEQRATVAKKLAEKAHPEGEHEAAPPHGTGSVSTPLWVGGGGGFGYRRFGGFGYSRGWGFSRGFVGGMGYVW
jgi:Spy/CpxP family protein refolding chaperone